MFTNNSRYAKLPESSPVDTKGERLLGTNVRLIPPTTGTFLHTVQGRDRLDLLALKYYGDPTKWWQISDANPKFSFPIDLLDRSPIKEEIFSLANPDMQSRFDALIAALVAAGESIRFPMLDFSESSLVVLSVTPTIRSQTIAQIQVHGFRFRKSFAWSDAAAGNEMFSFDDLQAKQNWRLLMEDLADVPGMFEVTSAVENGTLHVVYNSVMIARERILKLADLRGYEVIPQASQRIEQVGAQIVIPPNSVS